MDSTARWEGQIGAGDREQGQGTGTDGGDVCEGHQVASLKGISLVPYRRGLRHMKH